MTINVEFADGNAPIKAVNVVNPQGFLDLRLTVDTVGGARNPRTRRIDISNGETSVKIALSEVEELKRALDRSVDYGIDTNAA